MDPRKEEELLRWFEEIEDEELALIESEIESEPEPSSDDSDLDYVPSDESAIESEGGQVNYTENDECVECHETNSVENESVTENNEDEGMWCEEASEIPNFNFDVSQCGIKIDQMENMSPIDIFEKIWNDDVMNLLISSTNNYGAKLVVTNRPKTRNSRSLKFLPVTKREMKRFIGLCLLQGMVKIPAIRKLFTYDPLYYHPIFLHILSGRRFEQILRCFNAVPEVFDTQDRLHKVRSIMDLVIQNSNSVYSPCEKLSLDESMLLFRGRLVFRQYIKNKKSKYGIKFYELTTHEGFILNLEIYQGRDGADPLPGNIPKTEQLVLRLLGPFLNKGHHVFMDNFYNSVSLSSELLKLRTHSTGTLRANRRGNPATIVRKKLKKGEHIWSKKQNTSVYVSKWKDKRDVLAITTAVHPEMVTVGNRYGIEKNKPREIHEYNQHMSGIDRSDQMLSYYSCPRKTIRWHKKVLFRLLDISVWNSFLLYRKGLQKKIKMVEFREALILSLIEIDINETGRIFTKQRASTSNLPAGEQHFPAEIPVTEHSRRKHAFLKCRQCTKEGRRRETRYRCEHCEDNPPLCPAPCFKLWHC
ncbi:piggyBac transposable element-derived protein 4 [Coccinella septempunctata]|uniref:piggyBac transposable element-derived protein 4 n=1 Tax=Coccinella septempunctata TaxID=41139 RepID=UPI001D06A34A|nr:piggyBac transposable element-derived protein 4 [Coccinella septempunctata]